MDKVYSQNNEQQHITEYFAGRAGTFIDIGAFHAFQFSNTRALYEAGWNGVLVEPVTNLVHELREVYANEPRIKVIQAAIGLTNDVISMDVCDDAVSTTDKQWKKTWEDAGVKYHEEQVQQIAVADFLEQYGRGVNFISIDVEKTNLALFRAIPDWFLQQVEMICIEHDGGEDEIEARLTGYGFKRIHWNAENLILAK